MTEFSCKGCTDRHIGCHSTCEKYLKEKAEHDRKMNEAKRMANPIYNESSFATYHGRNYKGIYKGKE